MIARLAVGLILLGGGAGAAFAVDDKSMCLAGIKWPDARLAACGRLIARSNLADREMALAIRASLYYARGEYDRAVADYTQGIALKPNSSPPYIGRSNIWFIKRDYVRAIDDLNRALAVDPRSVYALQNRGNSFRAIGEYDKALTDYSQAIQVDGRFVNAYANRGELWRLKGELDRALADLDAALRLEPKHALALINRGNVRRYMGDTDRATADFNAALQILPDSASAMTGRGLVFEKKGDRARARSDFERALAVPEHRYDTNRDAQDTARARLAAIASGAPQPVIPSSPGRVNSPTAIPTVPIAASAGGAVASAAGVGRRVALVIGNSAYQKVKPLTNPQRDAEAVAALLRKVGFEVVTVAADATRETLVDALRNFANDAEASDWAMVYYAGHGVEVNGTNYLIPVDARLAADRDVQFETIPLDQVLAAAEGARKLRVVVLDACRDNPFTLQMRKTAAPAAMAPSTAGGAVGYRTTGRGLSEVKVSGATLVVYAAKHGQLALDGEGANSPFAIALVQRLGTPGVEINKIFRLVRDDVMELTAGRQEPYTYGSLPGREDFFFVAN